MLKIVFIFCKDSSLNCEKNLRILLKIFYYWQSVAIKNHWFTAIFDMSKKLFFFDKSKIDYKSIKLDRSI